MTFYELIRAALLKDAEAHPYPLKGCDPDPPERGGQGQGPDKQTDPQRIRGSSVHPVASEHI